jgi:hypothetical protein
MSKLWGVETDAQSLSVSRDDDGQYYFSTNDMPFTALNEDQTYALAMSLLSSVACVHGEQWQPMVIRGDNGDPVPILIPQNAAALARVFKASKKQKPPLIARI